MRTAGLELANDNIRVNCVHPTTVNTDMAHNPAAPVLGCGIVANARYAIQACNRACQDDRASTVGAEVGAPGLDCVPAAGEIDVKHVLPLPAGELLQGAIAADADVR